MTTIVYHGCRQELQLENKLSKRYGLVVLFFTSQKRLAKMYAGEKPFIYQVALRPDKVIDFNGQVSHSPRFRNMVFQVSREGYDVVAIENVLDRPNERFPFEKSTIYIVFDIDRVKNITRCTH